MMTAWEYCKGKIMYDAMTIGIALGLVLLWFIVASAVTWWSKPKE